MMSEITKTTLRIPKALLKQIKLLALEEEEKNQNDIILEAIEKFLKDKEP